MSRSELRAACSTDLSFPLHRPDTAPERLRAIADFMETRGWHAEIYPGGPAVEALEERMAELFGKPAALWFPTGTMAQGVAARLHAEATGRNRILLHPTSHLELHEEHGYRHAHSLEATPFGCWGETLTADDLVADHACAFIELPQRHNGGALPGWTELEAIKARATALDLPLHMDGARIWSARPFYGDRSYAAIANGFASIYVSFYKDIGALGGAALIGEADFIEAARAWRSRLGGFLVSPWPMVPDTLRLLDTRLAQMPAFVDRARQLATALDGLEGVQAQPAPPHVNMLHLRLPCAADKAADARDAVAREMSVWLGNRCWAYEGEHVSSLEIGVGEKALAAGDSLLVPAIERLAALVRG